MSDVPNAHLLRNWSFNSFKSFLAWGVILISFSGYANGNCVWGVTVLRLKGFWLCEWLQLVVLDRLKLYLAEFVRELYCAILIPFVTVRHVYQFDGVSFVIMGGFDLHVVFLTSFDFFRFPAPVRFLFVCVGAVSFVVVDGFLTP